ncbi:unnamed protein product [Pleuronectes platessa]|uniref:Uncharacterized protein n=1 Tax=Pleuronectes platessa TaxID=8262 RepID=A0A9N7ZF00_PLEPL|nr:unnamed protein product [Pleuronectes platessa]
MFSGAKRSRSRHSTRRFEPGREHALWDGIMEGDNHQEGETQGVKICDPPSESNPPADTLATSLSLLGNHMFPEPVGRDATADKEEPADLHLPDVAAQEQSDDVESISNQDERQETEETEISEQCPDNESNETARARYSG